MALSKEDRFQRGLHYAIVDEVDSILIDEARTPLIISGPADESPELYIKVNRIVPHADPPGQRKTARATTGSTRRASRCTCPRPARNTPRSCCARPASCRRGRQPVRRAQPRRRPPPQRRACARTRIYQRDVDYIVRDGEVMIVDEFTGRTLAGRRWSDGLHQAVEAKEGVPVQRENQTLASITFQNLFRMYNKLSGMTGTADTEAYEFQSIYGLEVIVIPTNRPMVRKDHSDPVFLNRAGKYRAVINEIKDCYARGQPVLVGTTSIEVSELLVRAAARGRHRRTRCSTPSSTSARRRSSPRPAARARSPSPPTWPAAAPTSCSAARSRPSSPRSKRRRRRARRGHQGQLKSDWQKRHDEVKAAGRPAHRRHRAPRDRAASTTSCAAAPAARATRARRASTCRSKTT